MSIYSFGNDLYTGKRSFDIIGKRRIWFLAAIGLVLISIASMLFMSPNLGIEFRGGSQFTVSNVTDTSHDRAYDVIAEVGKDSAPRVSTVGDTGIRVQTGELTDSETQLVRSELADAYGVEASEVTSSFIGPSWGQDVLSKAIRAMVVFMVIVGIGLAAYFKSWSISVGALGALLHDFIVTLGIYWILGFEITPATVIGLLTIMGYSLYDTVVVFDKVRENTSSLMAQNKKTYEEVANLAINQTLIRSLNTSITGLLPVMSVLVIGVYFLGADTLRDLALVMFVGMILSTLSSIYLAAPLAVALAMRNGDLKEHTATVLETRAHSVGERTQETGSESGKLVAASSRGTTNHKSKKSSGHKRKSK